MVTVVVTSASCIIICEVTQFAVVVTNHGALGLNEIRADEMILVM